MSDREIWIELADLFFLDTEPVDQDFERVACHLRQNRWSREQVEKTLVQFIAPHAAANLGYGIYPVSGNWTGFEEGWLGAKVERSQRLRATRPEWHFLIADWWYRRLLARLQLESLLSRLETNG